ncbi:hypothetical protein MERGE_000013 [Pneumocystis wakefieldiae]|uniref:Diphthamide biosynthesis protein 3 n=1 Tax=Pneumocystis wakefieldiae TaxID=38082 RepID=A0A899FZJ7_9ASCO|nr:hypothetical protein MERGE_000013 [Pneumocystis wakefieldiae]
MNVYDEIEIEDFTFNEELELYHYPCPCGDRFEISLDDLRDGEEIAYCSSCSLMVRVIYDQVFNDNRYFLTNVKLILPKNKFTQDDKELNAQSRLIVV